MLQAERDPSPAHEVPPEEACGYGFGLFLTSRSDIGQVVGHGGGYPGYGTMMIWHPASGLGVIAAGNLRYAPVHELADRQLVALVKAADAPRRPAAAAPGRRGAPRDRRWRLLERWDDAVADAAFAMNVDLDEPRAARRAAVEKAVDQVGAPLRLDPDREERSNSPAHRRWWLRGERGWLEVGAARQPRARAADPGAAGHARARSVAGAGRCRDAAARGRGRPGPGPMASRPPTRVDRGAVLRGLRVVAAWLGDGPADARPADGAGTARRRRPGSWATRPAPGR